MTDVGAKRLVNGVCCLTLTLSLLFSMGQTVEAIFVAPQVIKSFFEDLQPPAATIRRKFMSTIVFSKVAFTSCIVLNVVEFICYVIIFWDMYKHHKRHAELCLSNKPEEERKKKIENTVTAVGHFASWVSEMLIFGLIQFVLFYANNIYRENMPLPFWLFCVVLLPSVNFVTFPSIQAITSPKLRYHVFDLKFCKDKNDGDDMEMQTLT